MRRGKRKQWQNPRNPTEVGQERNGVCSQNRSGPAEAKKSKGDAQKVLVRGPEIPKGQERGEIAC